MSARAFAFGTVIVSVLALAQITSTGAESNGPPPGQGSIGVKVEALSDELRQTLHYKGPTGVVVATVLAGMPADEAGLQAGDIITAANGKNTTAPQTFMDVIAAIPVGKSLVLQVWSAGTKKLLTVKVVQHPQVAPQQAQSVSREPTVVPTSSPQAQAQTIPTHAIARGRVKLLTVWDDDLSDSWLVHARVLIQSVTAVRLYPPDFVLTTLGGLGQSFQGLRKPSRFVEPAEDLGACCAYPRPLDGDNQIVKVINFLVPKNLPDIPKNVVLPELRWKDVRITWDVQPPPAPGTEEEDSGTMLPSSSGDQKRRASKI